MKQILYTISLLLLLGACTDENYTDVPSANGGKPGKPVPVKLSLGIQPLQSPLTADTKAGSRSVSSTVVYNGMEITLVKTPVTRAADMSEIKNFWVFQFNGTEQTSKLIRKGFYSGSSVKEVQLNASSGVRNRIIVVANADEATFSGLAANSTFTLSEFNAMGIDFGQQGFPLFKSVDIPTPRLVFTGSADMVVDSNSQADIMLYRSTAQVTVNLKLGDKMQAKGYTSWNYQFMGIPKKSFYHSIGRTPAFPGTDVEYAAIPTQPQAILSGSATAFIEANLPVNLHHEVPFTTPDKRVTNAPLNSTYLQILGADMEGSIIKRSVIYQIHLGSNFGDDYSVSPNYAYTYNITIAGENEDDSRVVKFIPGYFGGALKMYDESNSPTTNPAKALTWRYEKRIEVYIQDVGDGAGAGGGVWLASGASMPSANSFMDGRKNTLDLFDVKENYLAIKKCIDLNGTGVTASNLVWYTPSFGQSLGIYVAGSSTLKTLPDATYWSSSTDGYDAWATKIRTGQSSYNDPVNNQNFLRCIKDINPGDMAQ